MVAHRVGGAAGHVGDELLDVDLVGELVDRLVDVLARGGFELGLIPDGVPGATGSQVFWGVPDAAAEMKRLLSLGGTVHEDVHDVGGGIKVATVKDPFGNLFGIIENPHFKIDHVQ